MATILRASPESLAWLADHLSKGGIAAVPTETVYGLAADSVDPKAVAKVFEAKGRPWQNPLIIHCHSVDQVEEYTATPLERWYPLSQRCWPGPLTLILKKCSKLPGVLTAGRDTVAVRIPANEPLRLLIRALGHPLAAPSANPFGYVSPTTAAHVQESMGDRVPYILDDGPCREGIESTIISLVDEEGPKLLRPGPVSQELLESVLQRELKTKPIMKTCSEAQEAPGLLKAHYQPTIPLMLWRDASVLNSVDDKSVALLLMRPRKECLGLGYTAVEVLTEDGKPEQAARHLYAMLRRLDKSGVAAIYAEAPPEVQAWQGVSDRLRRASSGWLTHE